MSIIYLNDADLERELEDIKMRIMSDYVYRNLFDYGNCLISERIVETFGEEMILSDLLENGIRAKLERRLIECEKPMYSESLKQKSRRKKKPKMEMVYILYEKGVEDD